ncbi:Alg9-like mannosyltransferase family domain containing protein [Elaphomyces granulatus]
MATASSPSSPTDSTGPHRDTKTSAQALYFLNLRILLLLIAFRILNALCLSTFFQPDEFFQSLEPAWQIVWGPDSGAWITWEWRHQLRSSIPPFLFAAVYAVVRLLVSVWPPLSPSTVADLFIAAPKTLQAVIAAGGDYYTWKLAGRLYGEQSDAAWATLVLTVLSPWQWFCSTRTLSNCLEATLTVMAWYWWPWAGSQGLQGQQGNHYSDGDSFPARRGAAEDVRWGPAEWILLRKSLLFAALAGVLRPTNVLIWICLGGFALARATRAQRVRLLLEAFVCCCTVMGISVLLDRRYYGSWTLPPLKFLYFNIAQSLAVFYGRNDWHYYLSQGYPLLLTTALPFTLWGLYQALIPSVRPGHGLIRRQLAIVCLFLPGVLSLISHKEVRFIYPLLPALHVLTAPPLLEAFRPAITNVAGAGVPRRLILLFLLLVNLSIALYTTLSHASGPLAVLSYLREQHLVHRQSFLGSSVMIPTEDPKRSMTVGFLMPCHSTPWRSHLVFPSIHAWALSCEPPVGLNVTQKAAYLDEADQFYDNPSHFLQHQMVGGLRYVPRRPSYLSSTHSRPVRPSTSAQDESLALRPHQWPDYLVFFAQLESTLHSALRSSSYGECWRTWNTAWHDDWRRRGDIVVWCLDPDAQQAWRNQNRKKASERRDRQFDQIIDSIKKQATAKGWRMGKQPSYLWRHWPFASASPRWSSSWLSNRVKRNTILEIFRTPSWPWSPTKVKKTSSRKPSSERDLWS